MRGRGREFDWYSARVRLICLVENHGGQEYWDSVFVFRAGTCDSGGWKPAFRRVVDLGRGQEQAHPNVYGERVVFRLVEVLTLDLLRTGDLDGAEVHFRTGDIETGREIPFEATFESEKSDPDMTGI